MEARLTQVWFDSAKERRFAALCAPALPADFKRAVKMLARHVNRAVAEGHHVRVLVDTPENGPQRFALEVDGARVGQEVA
jgi:hypothetical protein